MSTFTSGREPQNTTSAGKGPRKINKACVPCRTRKVKCDAATVGLPCSSCRGRQCTEDCQFLERKGRARKRAHILPTPTSTTRSPTRANNRRPEDQLESSPTSDRLRSQSPTQTEPDLLYLQILNDAMDKPVESGRIHTASSNCSKPEESLTPRNCQSAELSQLDQTDREYLAKKGVFDLPPSHHLDVLVKIYFDHVHPFSPVINSAEFIHYYKSRNCSLFLLRVIMTIASTHVPANSLSDYGFADHSSAQKSFFSKAKLLHDFAAEDDFLSLLQGSILLCMVILDHPTSRDFGFWFHNAIHLATKLDLSKTCVREDKPRKVLKLYRRIWWALYCLDAFHVSRNTERSLLLEDSPATKLSMRDFWEDENVSVTACGLLSAITPHQKALLVAHHDLCRIFRQCLSAVTKKPQQDPRQIMHLLGDWRKTLTSNTHVDRNNGTDTYYLSIQALSYRFECILCRQIRREPGNVEWIDFAKQRLRSAMLELDTIIMRVLADETLQAFPVFFITTITLLLALHIESAIDPSESDLIRSMAQISISQAMLILNQGKEVPVLKRALPIFNHILTRKNLPLVTLTGLTRQSAQTSPKHHMPTFALGQVSAQPPLRDNNMEDGHASHAQVSEDIPQWNQWQNDALLNIDFLGFDFSDQWQPF